MDGLESCRQIIERILSEYAQIPYAYGEIESQTVFDRERDHYLIVLAGWDKTGREHGCLVHVDLIDGKFWVQRDGTEQGIATDLEAAGVSKSQIVLAWNPPHIRKHTEYAVA